MNKYYYLKYGFNPEMELSKWPVYKKTTIDPETYKQAFLKSINNRKWDYIAYSGGIDSDAIYKYIEHKPNIITIENIDTSYIEEIYSTYKISSPQPDKICQWYQIFLQCRDHSLVTGLFHDNLNLEYIDWANIIKSKNWIEKYLEKFIIFNNEQLKELGVEYKEKLPIANNLDLFYNFYIRTSIARHKAIFDLALQMNIEISSVYLYWEYLLAIDKISITDRKNKEFFRQHVYRQEAKEPSGFYINETNTDLSRFNDYYKEFPWMTQYQKFWLYSIEQYEKHQTLL